MLLVVIMVAGLDNDLCTLSLRLSLPSHTFDAN